MCVYVLACMCACVAVCMRCCVHAFISACMHACVRVVCASDFACDCEGGRGALKRVSCTPDQDFAKNTLGQTPPFFEFHRGEVVE
jgi:hypothetical protein